MGAGSCILGLASLVHWFRRPHYTAYGIAAVLIGSFATGLALAYQVKYADGALDFLLFEAPTPLAYYEILLALALLAAGVFLARTRSKPAGTGLAFLAMAGLIYLLSSAMHTADRSMEPAPEAKDLAFQRDINNSKYLN